MPKVVAKEAVSVEAPAEIAPSISYDAISDDSKRFSRLDPRETGLDFEAVVIPDHELSRLYHSGFVVGGVAIGDVDNDGSPDVFCVGAAQRSKLYLQTSSFKFADSTDAAGLTDEDNPWSVGASFVDFDNDDDLDLYICNYGSANQLWINNGKGEFVERAKEFGLDIVDASMMAYFGDFDNDGVVDMYLLTNRLYNVEGWISNFDIIKNEAGEFEIAGRWANYFKLVPKPGGKHRVARKGRYDYLFKNQGGRAFTNVTKESGIAGDGHGMSTVLWDYDDDGDLDIYVCNDFQDADRLYENQGDGTFRDVIADVFKHTSWFSMGSDVGDINNDGRMDLFTVDMSGSSHYLSKVLMGSMTTHQHFLDTAEPRQYMRNFMHINANVGGSGGATTEQARKLPRFLETAQYSGVESTDWSWTPVLRDFDSDGRCDLFVTNGHVRNFNNPDISVVEMQNLKHKTYWNIHRDQKPMNQKNLSFRNSDGMRFEKSESWGLEHDGVSYAAASGDLDLDGDTDLIVMNLGEPVSVYRNDLEKSNSLSIRLKGTQSNRDGIGAKISIETDNGIFVNEYAPQRGYLTSNQPVVHFGLGKQAQVAKVLVRWPSGISQTLENVESNQVLTIVEPDSTNNVAETKPTDESRLFTQMESNEFSGRRENPFDDFALQPLLPNKLSQLGPGVAVGDLDQDGSDDVYVSAPARQAKSVFMRRKTQAASDVLNFESVPLDAVASKEEYTPLFFDFDGDQDLDIYTVCGGVEFGANSDLLSDSLMINDGTGKFSPADTGLPSGSQFSGSAAAAADFDRDGDLDLFVGGRVVRGEYPTSPRSMLLRNETETKDQPKFVDATESDATGLDKPGMVTSAIWSDVNNDGWIDLVLTVEWGSIRVYLNQEGKLVDSTESCGLMDHSGWWNGIAGADFDRDGDIDFVATNFGQNTKYSASSKKPASIYYGQFGNNKRPSIIETKTAESCELPVRGKSCSQHAMPHLADKFPTYHEFALAELSDIYSDNEIESASRYSVTELSSCLLRNDGNGVFSVEPLPWLAQIAPGFGVVAADFDADGWSDIFVAQNFFTPQRETGRMAGGLSAVLMGGSGGEFKSLWPGASGVAIEGDAKGAAVSDFNKDRRPDIAVGINDQTPRFFMSNANENQPLVLRLHGKGENAEAIGARVDILMEDGVTQIAEVYAGGSYLSQSTRDLFFGLGKSNGVKGIQVRWPDGTVQEFAAPSTVDEVVEIRQLED